MPGSRVCQFGVSSRSESQRSVRHEFATSPRSRTTWSIERSVRRRLMARPAWPAPMTTVLTFVRDAIGVPDQRDELLTTTLVGLVMMSNTAERFCDWATSASISFGRRVGVDVEVHGDVAEPVADVRIGAEDAEDVHVALDRRGDRSELNPAILCHRGDAGGEATAECGEDDLDRGGATVL